MVTEYAGEIGFSIILQQSKNDEVHIAEFFELFTKLTEHPHQTTA